MSDFLGAFAKSAIQARAKEPAGVARGGRALFAGRKSGERRGLEHNQLFPLFSPFSF
jgi:hypothetical protein